MCMLVIAVRLINGRQVVVAILADRCAYAGVTGKRSNVVLLDRGIVVIPPVGNMGLRTVAAAVLFYAGVVVATGLVNTGCTVADVAALLDGSLVLDSALVNG